MAENSFEQFGKPPEVKPEENQESEKMSKESRFIERLSVLKIDPQEMKEEDMDKLKSINDKIEQLDAPWVVRVMDQIKRQSGEEYLLEHFGPNDVEDLQEMVRKSGQDFSRDGIVGKQAFEVASHFIADQKVSEARKEREKQAGDTNDKIKLEVGDVPWVLAAEERARQKREKTGTAKEAETTRRKTPEEAAEVKTAQDIKREEVHKEIARRLVENPQEALSIFRKGVGLKLENACSDFASFWEKTGVKALKGLSFIGEKAVGYPAGEINRMVWNVGEFFEARPGIKSLNNTLQIYAHIERLQEGDLTPEKIEQLEKLLDLHAHAVGGQWEKIAAFNAWHERKKRTLEALRTFGGAGEKLETWSIGRKIETEVKKRRATGRRIREVAEKL